jgi:hypothetical protein
VIFALTTTAPGNRNSWPPASVMPWSGLPRLAGVWHSMQPAIVTTYSPYFTLLEWSGSGTWPAGLRRALHQQRDWKCNFAPQYRVPDRRQRVQVHAHIEAMIPWLATSLSHFDITRSERASDVLFNISTPFRKGSHVFDALTNSLLTRAAP